MYDYPCEHCEGHVRERIAENEALQVGRTAFVILENVPVGVCDRCGMRYYHASILKQAEQVLHDGGTATRPVPVAPYRLSSA